MTTLIAIWVWLKANPGYVYLMIGAAGQIALVLPDSKWKTALVNILHSIGPSPQVMSNGLPVKVTAFTAAPTPTIVKDLPPPPPPPAAA